MLHSHLYLHLLFALLICFSVTLVGCDDDASSDNTSGAESDAADTASSDLDGAEGAAECVGKHFFVRIDDFTPEGLDGQSGVDLDSVKLIKHPEDPGGPMVDFLPAEVMAYQAGTNADLLEPESMNPNNVLLLDSVSPDGQSCNGDPNVSVSLGGEGGYIVLRFEESINEGDELLSYEAGNCDFSGGTVRPASFTVSLALGVDGPWAQVFGSCSMCDLVGGAVPKPVCAGE